MIFTLAWKNMWRNPHRTFINMAAILFAVLLSVLTSSLKTGIFDNLVNNLVGYYSGYIQVHKSGYWDEQILENSFQQSPAIEQVISRDSRIVAFTPRLETFALVSAGEQTRGCLVTGILPEAEATVIGLRSRVTSGVYFRATDKSVILAEGLMRRLTLALGDTVVLIGQGYHGSTAAGKYPIVATVHFGSPELNTAALFIPIQEAQELFAAPEMVTSYVLALHRLNDLNRVASWMQAAVGPGMEVMTWEEMMPDITQHIRIDSGNMQIVQFILYLLIFFGLYSTMLMMMAERKFEMGMLVAVGMNKAKLTYVLMVESMFTLIGGCLAGLLVAVPVIFYLNRNPLRVTGKMAKAYEQFGFEAIFPTSINPSHFFEQGLIVLLLGMVLSIYPVYRVYRLNPITAMKK